MRSGNLSKITIGRHYTWLTQMGKYVIKIWRGDCDPVKNIWVIQFGMIACVMVLPLAFIAGPIRHIPVYWSCIDSCFGIFGIMPLYIVYKSIRKLELMIPKGRNKQ